MSQYCDSKKLESNWFNWLMTVEQPQLERLRSKGMIWTKVIGKVKLNGVTLWKNGHTFTDPCHHLKIHFVLSETPMILRSRNNILCKKFFTLDGKAHELHDDILDTITFNNNPTLIRFLESKKYIKELPTQVMWEAILNDIDQMCKGIATKFNPPTEEDHIELSHDALLQVTNKLVNKKLVYTPGRAPVFNLLTTTIFRCMYSIQNRRRNQRRGMHKFIEDIQSGVLPNNVRSFRVGMRDN